MAEEKEANHAEGTQEDGLGPDDLDQLEATGKGEDQAKGDAPSTEEFYPSSEVPPELQPHWKRMQAAFTQKTQSVAEVRKAAESVQEKAVLFDRVFSDPRVTNFVASLAGVSTEEASEDSMGDSEADESTGNAELSQLKQKMSYLENAMIQQRVAAEKAQFIKDHPNWEQEVGGKAALGNVWRARPELSMEEAYKLAAYDRLNQLRSERIAQKKANVETPGVPRRSVKSGVEVKDLNDALQIAREELGYTGPNP